MFIDTSAFVAIFAKEADADLYVDAIAAAHRRMTSGLVKLETVMALSRFDRGSVKENQQVLDEFINGAEIQVAELDETISDLAIETFERFGKGRRHPAQLNLSDCMSYAVAKHHRVPILFKGNDFGKTDALVARLT